jgi:predicted transcriptional regulator
MLVRDLMVEEAVACGPETPISQIVNRMRERKIHQVPVLGEGDKNHKKGEIIGMVTVNKIVTREFDPSKVMAKSLMIPATKIAPEETVERAAELILGSNMRALPVWNKELVGIISEQDLMRSVTAIGTAADAMKEAVTVEESEKIGKVKELIVQKNFSRVVVMKNGKVSGVVGTLDLMRILEPGWQAYPAKASSPAQQGRGRGFAEKQQLDSVSVKNALHSSPIVGPDEDLRKVVELLQENEEVLVQDGKIGIITPKDILRQFQKVKEWALVQIVGLNREEDALDVAMVHQKAAEIVKHLSKSAELQTMKIYIKKHHKQGPKAKYSVKIELPSSLGTFVAGKEHGRDDKSYSNLTTIVQRGLDDLERQIRKKQEKFRKPDQGDLASMRAAKEEGISLRERRIRKGRR